MYPQQPQKNKSSKHGKSTKKIINPDLNKNLASAREAYDNYLELFGEVNNMDEAISPERVYMKYENRNHKHWNGKRASKREMFSSPPSNKAYKHASAVPKPLNAHNLKAFPFIAEYIHTNKGYEQMWDAKSEIAEEI